jgi:hypothetical protein
LIVTVATALAAALGGASMAQAATGAATATLTPSKVSAASSAAISITGVGTFSTSGLAGLPSSVELLLQPGFASSAKSVSIPCAASQASTNTCPSASKIGSGSVGLSLFGTPITVPVTLYLGPPLQAGDIASVILIGTFQGANLNISGRLFTPAQGGLEVLLSSFPSIPLTLNSLSVSLYAAQTVTTTTTKTVIRTVFTGKGKHRHKKKVKKKIKKSVKTVYSLITNPPTCSGTWTGSAILTYTSGSDILPLSAPCTP